MGKQLFISVCIPLLLLSLSYSHVIWETALTDTLSQPQTSLSSSYHLIHKISIFKYCVFANVRNIRLFPYSTCGWIRKDSPEKRFSWNILAGERALTKWHIMELNIVRYSVGCVDGAFVKWIVQDQTFKRCGKYLPWDQNYIGNIIVNIYCGNLIETCNFISFYELISSHSPYDVVSYEMILSPLLMYREQDFKKMMFHIIGSSVLYIIHLNLTSNSLPDSSELSIFDGPSTKTPLLFHSYNRAATPTSFNASSYQVLILIMQAQFYESFDLVSHVVASELLIGQLNVHPCMGDEKYFCETQDMASYWHNYKHGLNHLSILRAKPWDEELFIDFEFEGSNSYAYDHHDFCQYGGLWILTQHDDGSAPRLFFHHCGEEPIKKFYILHDQRKMYIVSIQYPPLSRSMLYYRKAMDYTEYKSYYASPGNTYFSIPQLTYGIYVESAQSLANSVYIGEEIMLPKILYIYFVHYNVPKHCNCHLHLVGMNSEGRLYCTGTFSPAEHSVRSVPIKGRKPDKQYINLYKHQHDFTFTGYFQMLYFNCTKCETNGKLILVIRFAVERRAQDVIFEKAIEEKERSTLFVHPKVLYYKAGKVDERFYIFSKNSSGFEVMYFAKEMKDKLLHLNISLTECNKGEIKLLKLYKTNPSTFLTNGCKIGDGGCLLVIKYIQVDQRLGRGSAATGRWHFYLELNDIFKKDRNSLQTVIPQETPGRFVLCFL